MFVIHLVGISKAPVGHHIDEDQVVYKESQRRVEVCQVRTSKINAFTLARPIRRPFTA